MYMYIYKYMILVCMWKNYKINSIVIIDLGISMGMSNLIISNNACAYIACQLDCVYYYVTLLALLNLHDYHNYNVHVYV